MSSSLTSIFESAAKFNLWGDPNSLSGPGSNLSQTATIRKAIPLLLTQYKIKSLLDAPCGDFFWMKEVLPFFYKSGIFYYGSDIVEILIINNRVKFSSPKVQFFITDLTKGPIQKVDLIFTRDCFIHLSYKNIVSILYQYKKSGSEYLLVSTYSNKSRKNTDVNDFYVDGRALNLQKFPFFFSRPLELIVENCTEGNGAYADKALGLWRISDINLTKIRLSLVILSFLNFFERNRLVLIKKFKGLLIL